MQNSWVSSQELANENFLGKEIRDPQPPCYAFKFETHCPQHALEL